MAEHQIKVLNGRVSFGIKELSIVSGMIFLAGGGWWMLNAHAQEIRENARDIRAVDAKMQEDQKTIVAMKKDVERLADDVGEIKQEQRIVREDVQFIKQEQAQVKEGVARQESMTAKILDAVQLIVKPRPR